MNISGNNSGKSAYIYVYNHIHNHMRMYTCMCAHVYINAQNIHVSIYVCVEYPKQIPKLCGLAIVLLTLTADFQGSIVSFTNALSNEIRLQVHNFPDVFILKVQSALNQNNFECKMMLIIFIFICFFFCVWDPRTHQKLAGSTGFYLTVIVMWLHWAISSHQNTIATEIAKWMKYNAEE